MKSPLKPDDITLTKLGSLIVHYQEVMDQLIPDDMVTVQSVDRVAIQVLELDPDVVEWLGQMDDLSLLPKKRS